MFVGIFADSVDSGFVSYKINKITGSKIVYSVDSLSSIGFNSGLFGDSPVYVCRVRNVKFFDGVSSLNVFSQNNVNIIFVYSKSVFKKRLTSLGVEKFLDCTNLDLAKEISPAPDANLVAKVKAFAGMNEDILLEFIKYCKNIPNGEYSFVKFKSFCASQGKYSPQMLLESIYSGNSDYFTVAYDRAVLDVNVHFLAKTVFEDVSVIFRVACAYYSGCKHDDVKRIIPSTWVRKHVNKYGRLLSSKNQSLKECSVLLEDLNKFLDYRFSLSKDLDVESLRVCLFRFVRLFSGL